VRLDDIGKGLGPAVVVLLINASQHNRQTAFTTVTLMWLVCGALLLMLVWTVGYDEQKVKDTVRRHIHKTNNNNTSNSNNTQSIASHILAEVESPLVPLAVDDSEISFPNDAPRRGNNSGNNSYISSSNRSGSSSNSRINDNNHERAIKYVSLKQSIM
jgi:hypothetical protein